MMIDLAMAANGLELSSGHWEVASGISCPLTSEDIQAKLQSFFPARDGLVIIWQVHRIIWGRWVAGRLSLVDGSSLEAQYVEELRAFDESGELHLRRRGEQLSGRYIQDGHGAAVDYVDSLSPFYGKAEATGKPDVVCLRDEDRKLEMELPASLDGSAETCGLATRNYITANPKTGQASYNEYRFLGIVSMDGRKKNA